MFSPITNYKQLFYSFSVLFKVISKEFTIPIAEVFSFNVSTAPTSINDAHQVTFNMSFNIHFGSMSNVNNTYRMIFLVPGLDFKTAMVAVDFPDSSLGCKKTS